MTRQEQLLWLLLIVGGFFSGGVMYSRILPKLFLKKDICSSSPDKNPGASNVFVSCGVTLGMLCLLMDMLKGFVPVYFAIRLLDPQNLCFAAVLFAPVLGHAVAPFDHLRGGKCIATSFGELLALLPVSRIVFLLAGLYVFFSVVIKISPNRLRSITTFGLFGSFCGIWFTAAGRISLAVGLVLLSATAVLRHTHWLSIVPEDEPQPLPEEAARAEASSHS